MYVLHGQHGKFIGSGRVAAVLHIPRDGEQLRGGHNVGGGVDDDLVSGFEGHGFVLTQRQGIQGTIWRVLRHFELNKVLTTQRLTLVAHCKASVRAQPDNSSC